MTRTFSIVTPAALEPFSTKWRTNVDKQTHKNIPVDEGQCCILCGKKTLNAQSFVLISDDSHYVTKEELGENDLGMFPVGSDCVKKFKAANIPIYTRQELKGCMD